MGRPLSQCSGEMRGFEERAKYMIKNSDRALEIVESKNDLRSYKVSFEKIKNNLNFSPKYSIENTVEKIIEKIHQNKLNPKDSEFSNISRLTENVKSFENYHFDESL